MASGDWKTRYIKGANGKAIYFEGGGYIIDVLIPEESLKELEVVTSKKGNKFRKFKISPLRNGKDEYGNTHSIFVSERVDGGGKPDQSHLGNPDDQNDEFNAAMGDTDEMPF